MKSQKPKRRDRHEKLMDERVRFSMGFLDPRAAKEAIDHLFFEVDLLIHEVEELKKKAKS